MPTEVMNAPQTQNRKLSEFRNEPLTDFTKPQNRTAMEKALEKVKAEFGREYPLVIGGQRITGLKTFDSTNPSRKGQLLGKFQKGVRELEARAGFSSCRPFAESGGPHAPAEA